MTRRITGLQRQVYSLYKRCLLMASTKPLETRSAWFQFISMQFRHPTLGGGLKRKDVGAIEYYLRRGERMLEGYEKDGVRSVVVSSEQRWPEGWVAKGGKQQPKDS